MGFSLLVYNLALLIGLLALCPFWIGYLLAVPKARAGFWEKLGVIPQPLRQQLLQLGSRKRIWFHAVSVGELNAIKTLIPELLADFDVLLSTTTLTGHTLANKLFPNLPVLYFPYDFPGAVNRVLRIVQPDLVVVAETELWPNFINAVSRKLKKPIILINGRLSQRSFKGYANIKSFIKPSLNQFTHFYMQSQADANRMKALGDLAPDHLTVVGNLKFDLSTFVEGTKKAMLANLLNLQAHDTVLTFASTHSGEDALFIDTYLKLKKDFPELKLVLAPRHPERLPEVRAILNSRAIGYSVRSQLNETHLNQQDVMVLDSIGELMLIYSLSTIAVMGGSFVEKGGQNPLEPISQRVPVIFGPSMENFAEISRMILESGAGFQVRDTEALAQAVTQLLTQPEIYDTIAENGQQLLENNRGAKALVLRAIYEQLN